MFCPTGSFLASFLLLLNSVLADSEDSRDSCPWTCANGAECLQVEDQESWYCDCAHSEDGGFEGFHCESPYRDCHDGAHRLWRCYNGGFCGEVGNSCRCGEEFSGKFCQNYIGEYAPMGTGESAGPRLEGGYDPKGTGDNHGYIFTGIAFLSVLALVSVLICCYTEYTENAAAAAKEGARPPGTVNGSAIDNAVAKGTAEVV